MATFTPTPKAIYIYGRDFSEREFRVTVYPYIIPTERYTVEYTDIDGCCGGIYRDIFGRDVPRAVARALNDPYTYNIKIILPRKDLKND